MQAERTATDGRDATSGCLTRAHIIAPYTMPFILSEIVPNAEAFRQVERDYPGPPPWADHRVAQAETADPVDRGEDCAGDEADAGGRESAATGRGARSENAEERSVDWIQWEPSGPTNAVLR